MSNGLPWFKFSTTWKDDADVAACSLGAQGFAVRLLCIAAASPERGRLLHEKTGEPLDDDALVALAGRDPVEARGFLAELLRWGVFVRDRQGVLVRAAMLEEEELRQKRATAGRLGGEARQRSLKGQPRKQTPAVASNLPKQNGKHPGEAGAGAGAAARKQNAEFASDLLRQSDLPRQTCEQNAGSLRASARERGSETQSNDLTSVVVSPAAREAGNDDDEIEKQVRRLLRSFSEKFPDSRWLSSGDVALVEFCDAWRRALEAAGEEKQTADVEAAGDFLALALSALAEEFKRTGSAPPALVWIERGARYLLPAANGGGWWARKYASLCVTVGAAVRTSASRCRCAAFAREQLRALIRNGVADEERRAEVEELVAEVEALLVEEAAEEGTDDNVRDCVGAMLELAKAELGLHAEYLEARQND